MMTEQEVKQLLIDTQAILEGHFLLTSGLHSPSTLKNSMYCNIQNIQKHFVKNLAERFRDQTLSCYWPYDWWHLTSSRSW